ncbi:hypothetical protein BGZ96_009294 [Linnemannia gamsii]|uniref:Uncharacterized protein n=1 Tax=Linnemannia gamsii TaxID=64522 RepID=A0ABQ7JWI7_9FUNG|nr:hypothetical protein BGZ96_009294 [Linnemannia gamsii]
MDFARSELVQRQPVQNITTGVLIATDPTLDTVPPTGVSTTAFDEYEHEDEENVLADGITTPARRSTSSIGSPSTSDDFDVHFSTPPPMPAFNHPPSPPRPGYNAALEYIARRLQPSRLPESAANRSRAHQYDTRTDTTVGGDNQSIYKRWFRAQLPDSSFTDGPLPDDMIPRRPLTSIAGSNRCLWPSDMTSLTLSTGTSRELSFQNHDRGFNHHQSTNNGATLSSLGGATSYMMPATMTPQKNHDRSDSFKDSGECLLDLQPCRKARRTMDGPYFKERNDRMVAGHVRKLIQEAVEDGVGELDLSNLELTDLPPEVRDLNYAIVYNERGSFALSRNRLKLFLSCNQLMTIPMHVFELHNLSVLSLRNNNIKAIPPEIGLLYNLVELSIGGNLLEHLPSQIALLPKLHILTIHPNPLMVCPEQEGGIVEQDPAEQQPEQQDPNGDDMEDIGAQQEQQQQQQQQSVSETSTMGSSQLLESQSNEDVEMSPALELGSQAGLSFHGADSTNETHLGLGEQAQTAPIHPQITTPRARVHLPPHRVLRSRFPTLAHLAGNVILNYMDAQMTKGGDEGVDRPRKDSKISMEDGDGWLDDPIEPCNSGDVTRYDISDGCRKQAVASKQKAAGQAVLFKEEDLKEYMTPYLFDIFKRARINNRCAGCQRRFWKPCRIVIVWQDVLGQKRVPVRWKGCGIGMCPGVPETLWPRQTISSSSLPSSSGATRTSVAHEGSDQPA